MKLMKMTTIGIAVSFLATATFAQEMPGKQYDGKHHFNMEHHVEDFSRSKENMTNEQKQMMSYDKIRHHENMRVMELERELYHLKKMNELLEKQVKILQEMNYILKNPMKKDPCDVFFSLCYKKKYGNLNDEMDHHKPFYREQHMNRKIYNEMTDQYEDWDELNAPSTMSPSMEPDYNEYNSEY